MANLSEMSRWEAGIYQWETSDPVQGGPNGIDNRPTRELANRTRWLYDELDRVRARMDDPNFYKSITVSDSKALFDANNYLHIGADAAGGYIRNKKTGKGIQLKNDGTLQYDGADVITTRKVSNNPDDYTVATVPSSFALNKAFDNSIKRGGAIGLGGAAHQIAIGWDTPGLVAKVDTQTVNVGVPTGAIAYLPIPQSPTAGSKQTARQCRAPSMLTYSPSSAPIMAQATDVLPLISRICAVNLSGVGTMGELSTTDVS